MCQRSVWTSDRRAEYVPNFRASRPPSTGSAADQRRSRFRARVALRRRKRRSAPGPNAWNADPKPIVWTRIADEILDILATYCGGVDDSAH